MQTMNAARFVSLLASLFVTHPIAFLVAQEPGPTVVELNVRGESGAVLGGASLSIGTIEQLDTKLNLQRAVGRSDADGVIELDLDKYPVGPTPLYGLLTAPNRASVRISVAYLRRRSMSSSWPESRIQRYPAPLLAAARIRGLVRDGEDRPIVGARLEARDIFMAKHLRTKFHRNYFSYGRSDQRGRFDLHGVLSRGASLTIQAPGYRTEHIPYWQPKHPLIVTMTKCETANGRVVDSDGGTASVRGEILYRDSMTWTNFRTQRDGHFAVELDRPGPYQLTFCALSSTTRSQMVRQSEVLRGVAEDIRLAFRKPLMQAAALDLVVTSAATGKPMPEFSVFVEWSEQSPERRVMEARLHTHGQAATGGHARVVVPPNVGSAEGYVLVRAVGYQAVMTSFGRDLSVVAELLPESAVVGTVVDVETRKPLAGVSVQASETLWKGHNALTRATRTDASGRFLLDGLTTNPHSLILRLPGRQAIIEKLGYLRPREHRKLVLSMSAAVSLTGRVKQGQAGWLIGQPPQIDWVALDEGGKFTLSGIAPGVLELKLRVRDPANPEADLDVSLPAVELLNDDLAFDFDPFDKLPGRVVGKIRFSGASFPASRVMVQLETVPRRGLLGQLYSPETVGQTVAHADGSFGLALLPGHYVVNVIDLATGLVLSSSDGVAVDPSQATKVGINLDLAHAIVTVRDARKKNPTGPLDYQVSSHDAPDRWIPIRDGAREWEVFLPCSPATLSIRARIDRRRFLNRVVNSFVLVKPKVEDVKLAETKILPIAGRTNRFDVVLRDPK